MSRVSHFYGGYCGCSSAIVSVEALQRKPHMPIDPDRVLFVGDRNLGPLCRRVIKSFFPGATSLLWRSGDAENKQSIRKAIRAGDWDVLLSVYNDLIFEPDDLASVASSVRVNLHPSIPIAGVGHDTWPLICSHTLHGSTAHFLAHSIDTGRIINVMERPLSADVTYGDLRIANQDLQLRQLLWLCRLLSECDDKEEAMSRLEAEVENCGRKWLPRTYISIPIRESLLQGLRRSDPGHRVFKGASPQPNLKALPNSIVLASPPRPVDKGGGGTLMTDTYR